jgi:hypothetical protein
MKETYPLPGKHLRVVPKTEGRVPEFGANREEFEERIFRVADHFNVVRFGAFGSEVATVKTFPEAVYLASQQPRSLIYAVSSFTAQAFCLGKKDWEKYARITLELRHEKAQAGQG